MRFTFKASLVLDDVMNKAGSISAKHLLEARNQAIVLEEDNKAKEGEIGDLKARLTDAENRVMQQAERIRTSHREEMDALKRQLQSLKETAANEVRFLYL